VFPAQHPLDFSRFDLGLEFVEAAAKVGIDVLARLRPLDQHREIRHPAGEGGAQLDVLGQPALALQHALRLGLVLPEVRMADLRLQDREFVRGRSPVKDNSASRSPV
jgi:hypothetical protein